MVILLKLIRISVCFAILTVKLATGHQKVSVIHANQERSFFGMDGASLMHYVVKDISKTKMFNNAFFAINTARIVPLNRKAHAPYAILIRFPKLQLILVRQPALKNIMKTQI